jgi:hypothetical protein
MGKEEEAGGSRVSNVESSRSAGAVTSDNLPPLFFRRNNEPMKPTGNALPNF